MRKFCVGHSHTSAHGCECETLAELTVYSLDNDYVGTAVLSVSRQLLRVKLTLQWTHENRKTMHYYTAIR